MKLIRYRSVRVAMQVIATVSLVFRAAAEMPAPTQAHALGSSEAPLIVSDEKNFDFGKIQHGQTVVHRFKISNAGKTTLHIKEVKANCGCTSTVIGKMALAPDENTEIEANFTPESDFSGAVRKTIMVISDDPAHSRFILRFAADVLPDLSSGKPTL